MQTSAPVITVFLILSCLTFNYTFPLHRDPSVDDNLYLNGTQSHIGNVVDRTKKMAVNVFKRFKTNTPEELKELNGNIKEKISVASHKTNEKLPMNDFRQFEQLVIMKKYPYLDLKEFEARYTLSPEHARHNQKLYSGSNFGSDPGICEGHVAEADVPSVEVSNRGLSGFAIPKMGEKKYGPELVDNRSVQMNLARPKPNNTINTVLRSLKSDVSEYLQDKGFTTKID